MVLALELLFPYAISTNCMVDNGVVVVVVVVRRCQHPGMHQQLQLPGRPPFGRHC